MRTRNNTQNWEPLDVCMWETSRAHQQNNWWPNNQLDTTSYLQLPPRKFQEQRRHVVNYEEEEDLSWCNKIKRSRSKRDKIKSIKQNDELMPQFNQKYRTYIEHLERKAVHEMTSHTQMEIYMSAINPHISKALRTNIHYGSRYAATSVGDVMKKAEECYLKDLYVRAGLEKDRKQGNADREVMCAEVNTRGRNQWQSSKEKKRSWTSQEYQENRGT